MPNTATGWRRFRATLEGAEKSRVYVPLPFDAAEAWGARPRYHVTGTVNGMPVRGSLGESGRGHFLALGPAWRRCAGLRTGDSVEVALAVEGPQREGLPAEVAAALEAEPEAGAFFDSLATFYRKGYLAWIDATKRRPEVRAVRIAGMVELLKAGQKQRPR